MSDEIAEKIARNLQDVRLRIDEAVERSRQPTRPVRLVAVTKSAAADWIAELIALGQLHLAENRPQQLIQRAAALPAGVTWHMIGHLQRNKVELVWPKVEWIHSIDSLRLWRQAVQQAAKSSQCPQLLLEVNISGEASKSGFTAEEMTALWATEFLPSGLPIRGFMTMAPLAINPEDVRPVFRGLRELRDRLAERSRGQLELPELSMGMSGDFTVAVEEGATMVRIGSRLFEGLS